MSQKTIVKFASKSFTLPDTCIRLRAALDNARASVDDIATIISVDPSLSAKILKLANSALFRFPSQIETVGKALNVIGGEAAYNISIVETANIAFNKFNSDIIDFKQFWHDAVMCGVLAKSIAQQKQMRGSERFFVLGVLQSLSELLVAVKLEDKYKLYLQDSDDLTMPIARQSSHFKFSFAECSGAICKEWALPSTLTEPLKQMCFPPLKRYSAEESVLYLAMAMSHSIHKDVNLLDIPKLNIMAVELLDLSPEDYDMISNYAKLETSNIASLINS